jgi:uncharacterized protein (UPF0333 family)
MAAVSVFALLVVLMFSIGVLYFRKKAVNQQTRSAIRSIRRRAKAMPANDNRRSSRRSVTGGS